MHDLHGDQEISGGHQQPTKESQPEEELACLTSQQSTHSSTSSQFTMRSYSLEESEVNGHQTGLVYFILNKY